MYAVHLQEFDSSLPGSLTATRNIKRSRFILNLDALIRNCKIHLRKLCLEPDSGFNPFQSNKSDNKSDSL